MCLFYSLVYLQTQIKFKIVFMNVVLDLLMMKSWENWFYRIMKLKNMHHILL